MNAYVLDRALCEPQLNDNIVTLAQSLENHGRSNIDSEYRVRADSARTSMATDSLNPTRLCRCLWRCLCRHICLCMCMYVDADVSCKTLNERRLPNPPPRAGPPSPAARLLGKIFGHGPLQVSCTGRSGCPRMPAPGHRSAAILCARHLLRPVRRCQKWCALGIGNVIAHPSS